MYAPLFPNLALSTFAAQLDSTTPATLQNGVQLRLGTRTGPNLRTYNSTVVTSYNTSTPRGWQGMGSWLHVFIWLDQLSGKGGIHFNGRLIERLSVVNAWTAGGTRKFTVGDPQGTSTFYNAGLFDLRWWGQTEAADAVANPDGYAKASYMGEVIQSTARYFFSSLNTGIDETGNGNNLAWTPTAGCVSVIPGPPTFNRKWASRHRVGFRASSGILAAPGATPTWLESAGALAGVLAAPASTPTWVESAPTLAGSVAAVAPAPTWVESGTLAGTVAAPAPTPTWLASAPTITGAIAAAAATATWNFSSPLGLNISAPGAAATWATGAALAGSVAAIAATAAWSVPAAVMGAGALLVAGAIAQWIANALLISAGVIPVAKDLTILSSAADLDILSDASDLTIVSSPSSLTVL